MSSTPSSPLSVTPTQELRRRARVSLESCGVELAERPPTAVLARSPISGGDLFEIPTATGAEVESTVGAAKAASANWRRASTADRGTLVRRFADLVAEHRTDLAELITIEIGRVPSAALGEVQEVIDICGFATGLSSQFTDPSTLSGRPGRRQMETWHPLGVVAVISAFDSPVAAWCRSLALALVCGDSIVWKPSRAALLTAAACSSLLDRALVECGAPPDLHRLVVADAEAGAALVDSPDVALVSATGSEQMRTAVAPRVAARFGRFLPGRGGDGAAVIAPSADLELATREVALATAATHARGRRIRRLIVHESIADECVERVASNLVRLPIGDPLADGVRVGPLIGVHAYRRMVDALAEVIADGGEVVLGGERREAEAAPDAYYVEPTVVRVPVQTDVLDREIPAPLLYVMTFADLDEAIAIQNDVLHKVSSVIFTGETREAEHFLAVNGPHHGVINVNVASGLGGGAVPATDGWRRYMRRASSDVDFPP